MYYVLSHTVVSGTTQLDGQSEVKEAHEPTDMRATPLLQAELPGVKGMGVDSLDQGSPTFSLLALQEPLDHVYAHCSGFALDRVSRLQSQCMDNQMTRPQIVCERVHKTYAVCMYVYKCV